VGNKITNKIINNKLKKRKHKSQK